MKQFSLLGIFFMLIFIACSGTTQYTEPEPPIPPNRTELAITVESTNDSVVKVAEERPLTEDEREGQGLGSLSMLSWLNDSKTKAFMKIFSGLSVSDVTKVWNDLTWLYENTKIRDVQLFINSPGGDAFSGLALADQIEKAKKNGFTITAHASGIIASAAVPVFAVCNKRFAANGTIFMVHEAALWKWPGRETASDIRSQNELMDLLRDRYISKLVANSKLTKEEWEDLERKTTWFSVDKAIEWGLVDNESE